MHRSRPQSPSDVAGSRRVEQIAAAFAAFRRVHGRGQRIPLGLRRQFVAALDAGVSAGALGKACGVSWSQSRYWRAPARAAAPVTAAPQVMSVVDRPAGPACSSARDGAIELRVGAWRVRVERVTE